MSAAEENRNEILSRIVSDLFANTKGGEELSSKIHRLRGEIKKVIEGEDTIFGKLRELMTSFEIIIPEEKQRYNAAIQALSTTSKLSRQEIVKAVNNQLAELKILEKGVVPAHAGWRDELTIMEAKSRELRDEIAKLREKIGRLESEEKEILDGKAAREKERELVEKAVGELFREIGAEITSIKKRIEEFTAESAASQPIWPGDSVKRDIPSGEKGGGEQKSEIRESTAPKDTEWQKKCPMCGGRMNFHSPDEMWICYSCAYEESEKKKFRAKAKRKASRRTHQNPLRHRSRLSIHLRLLPSLWHPCHSTNPRNQKRNHPRLKTSPRARKRIALCAIRKWIGTRWIRPGGVPSAITREVFK